MYKMTQAEISEFLNGSPHTAKLASVRPDGRPHVTPIWFVMDGEDLVFTTWHITVKATNLHEYPRAAVCVDDEHPPYAYVLMEGKVEFSEDLQELRRWATMIGGKYMGAEQAEVFGKRNGVPGELLGRLRVDHWVGQANIAD